MRALAADSVARSKVSRKGGKRERGGKRGLVAASMGAADGAAMTGLAGGASTISSPTRKEREHKPRAVGEYRGYGNQG